MRWILKVFREVYWLRDVEKGLSIWEVEARYDFAVKNLKSFFRK